MALTGKNRLLDENQIPIQIENFINGEFAATKNYLDSFDPSTGEVWAKIPSSGSKDVDDAVSAARNAFPK